MFEMRIPQQNVGYPTIDIMVYAGFRDTQLDIPDLSPQDLCD